MIRKDVAPHPLVPAYTRLARELGPGLLADLLLARWVADPSAETQWANLLIDLYEPERAAA